jgi:hypothetical protein
MPLRHMQADPRRTQYLNSKQHELRLARELGGRRLANSGGARRSKWDQYSSQGGDIETEAHVIEHKHTKKDSISIKKEWWKKVEEGATRQEKLPALVITFVSGGDCLDLAVVPLVDLQRLTGVQLRPEGGRR